MNQGGIAAVVWAPQEGRTERIAEYLNAQLHHIHYLRYKRPLLAPIKYIPQCLKTWSVLRKQKPEAVYVTNPPVFAALSVYIYCRFSGAKFLMDTHPPSLYGKKWSWSVPLQRALAKRAFLNITDQEKFKELFESWGAKTSILRHPPFDIPNKHLKNIDTPNMPSVTVVSTFAEDEPVDLVVEAAKQIPEVRFFILGDVALADKALIESAPENVVFTGYLLHEDYWNRLYSSSAVMVLTEWPYSLMLGAEEGMALSKPLILSKQPVLTEHYTKGTVFVEHTVEGMSAGIQTALNQEQLLSQEISELAEEKKEMWSNSIQEILSLIGGGQSCKVPQPGI